MLSLVGLLFDLVGVLALGYDVIRIQRALLSSARTNALAYEKLDSDYGGTADWLNDITKSLRWVQGYEFQEHHAEDEVSYNARQVMSLAKDVAHAAAGIAEYVLALGVTLKTRADEEAEVAGTSLRLSALGLGCLIVLGFLLQAHAPALQMCGNSSDGICAWIIWL